MQAVKEEVSFRTAKVIVFPTRMADKAPIPPPVFHPPTHGNWAQWAAVILALVLGISNIGLTLYFHSAESATKTSDEHTNSLIDAKLGPAIKEINGNIDNKLTPIAQQLKDLIEKVGKLEGRFDQLDADEKRLTKLQLNKLSAQITNAQRTKRHLEPTLIAGLGNDVLAFTNSSDQEISTLAWNTAIQLADYRTILNREVAKSRVESAKAAAKRGTDFDMEARVLDPTNVTFGIAYDQNKTVPFDQAARYERLGNPLLRRDFGRPFYIASGKGVELLLDGHYLKNVIFHDAQISYQGGPLVMENVYFVNCTFHVQPSPNARQLTIAVLNSTSITFDTAKG